MTWRDPYGPPLRWTTVSVDGSEMRVMRAAPDVQTRWSPDGATVAVHLPRRQHQPVRLFTMNDGGAYPEGAIKSDLVYEDVEGGLHAVHGGLRLTPMCPSIGD